MKYCYVVHFALLIDHVTEYFCSAVCVLYALLNNADTRRMFSVIYSSNIITGRHIFSLTGKLLRLLGGIKMKYCTKLQCT